MSAGFFCVDLHPTLRRNLLYGAGRHGAHVDESAMAVDGIIAQTPLYLIQGLLSRQNCIPLNDPHAIKSLDELVQHYPRPRATSTAKVRDSLTDTMRNWLEHSPFFVMSSVGEYGVDCSPRGDSPGKAFRVMDRHTIAIPDRRGNNRIDTLRNILNDNRVGLVFLIPGIDEALRIKGCASISVNPALLNEFALDDVPPATVILVSINAVYVQNARAMRSSELWNANSQHRTPALPSAAELSSADILRGCNARTVFQENTVLKESVIEIHRRIHQPIATATGLPNERYTSQAAFVEDRDKVMAPSWACIGFADDLPEKECIHPVDFMGLPLLITRDNDDVYRVFHNVCSHRGLHLADAPCRTNGLVRCPYHSWTYQLDGTLKGTPHIGGFGTHQHADFDKTANGLKPVRSTIWLGCVFINLSGTAEEFDRYIEPLTRQFDALCTEEQRLRFVSAPASCRSQLTVESNWKLAVENYLESYHLPTVHPELNRISPLSEHFSLDYFDQGAGQGSLNYQRTIINGKALPQLEGWPEQSLNKALYPVLYPNTLIGLHADHLFFMMLQPINQHQTIEHVRISYVGEEALEGDCSSHHKQVLESWNNVFSEDIFAVERMQKGRASPGYTGGAFAPAMDEPTVHFHRWVASCLLANADTGAS